MATEPSPSKRARVDAEAAPHLSIAGDGGGSGTAVATAQVNGDQNGTHEAGEVARFPGVSEEIKACRLPAAVAADDKAQIRREITLEDRSQYFALNECPITPSTEQRMEQISKVVSNETLAGCWDAGQFHCARCARLLYLTSAKFEGPCLWPSFREAAQADALKNRAVPAGEYNGYQCEVNEVYCGGCSLFLGHSFKDGAETGDTHPDAAWRHCVLSLSLSFTPDKPATEAAATAPSSNGTLPS